MQLIYLYFLQNKIKSNKFYREIKSFDSQTQIVLL